MSFFLLSCEDNNLTSDNSESLKEESQIQQSSGKFIANNLNIPVKVFLIIDAKDTTGAIAPVEGSSNYRSNLGSGKRMPLRKFTASNELKIVFEMTQIPENDGVRGVKAALGSGDDVSNGFGPHHFEFLKKSENKYWAVLHFLGSHKKASEDKLRRLLPDEDPNVNHPD